MDAHLTFKEHHNRCMKKASAAEGCLRSLTKTYAVIPACVSRLGGLRPAVARYESELWWDPKQWDGKTTSNSSYTVKPGPSLAHYRLLQTVR
jgi:hypothetical protein